MMNMNFWKDEEGQGMVEVSLIITFMALVIVASAQFLGEEVLKFYFNKIVNIIKDI